jgi:integrase
VLVAALNWAYRQKWLPAATPKQAVEADDPDKGRPLCLEEFERMLTACEKVCRHDPGPWQYLLQGLWESGLRVSEALNLSFDIEGTIQVVRERRGVVLKIPGRRQKNRRHQVIPTTPSFVKLLEQHPTQTGHVFNPTRRDGRPNLGRMTLRHVSRTIMMIGGKAGVIVNEDGKPASAHDLRRSFGQRLADAGVAPRDLQKIMRHRRLETTEQYYLRDDALDIGDRIAEKLGSRYVPGYTSGNRRARRRPR